MPDIATALVLILDGCVFGFIIAGTIYNRKIDKMHDELQQAMKENRKLMIEIAKERIEKCN